MPWDIDYTLLMFTQLKKSFYHLPKDVNITIDAELNLSSYLIDWDKSKISKDYFIDKFKTLLLLLKNYKVNEKIYIGEELYGHLNQQREVVSSEVDFYINICPDIYFSEYALTYLIESAKQVKNKYFVITPQTSKVGDADWDEITDPNFINIPYSEYLDVDVYDVRYSVKYLTQEKTLSTTQKSKWAGWFDLYSKSFYEELCPYLEEWNGYGPWDHYSMIISTIAKQNNVDFQQYILRGETIWMYPSGPLLENNSNGFTKYYRDRIVLNSIPNQRQEFEAKMDEFINKTITQLKNKNIL
jgi:hypothetical protein